MATNYITPDHWMHKNRLQQYTQRSALPLPIYKTVNEGSTQASKFRSTVLVDGTEYTSKLTFLRRKTAEQEVAKFAFECVTNKMGSDIGGPLIHQDRIISKAILNEFATKKKIKIPIYETTSAEGSGSVYLSSLTFNGKTYTGEVAGSKKMAEQLAAHTAVQSLLGSDSGDFLAQMIKSKGILSPPPTDSNFLPIAVQTEVDS